MRPTVSLLVIPVLCLPLAGQTSAPPAPNPPAPKTQFGEFLSQERQIWSAPLKIKKKQVPWLVLFGAGTAALIATDRKITDNLPNTPAQMRWGTRVARAGGVAGVLGIGSGIAMIGTLSHNDRLQTAGLAATESAIHSLVVTYALKLAIGRERPYTGSGEGEFWSAYGQSGKANTSFPSGHSMASWAVASAIAHQYSDKKYVPWLAYGFAASISASRVAGQKHYVSDVVAGGTAGFLIGRFVSRRYQSNSAGLPQHGFRHRLTKPDVVPEISPANRVAKLNLVWNWQ